MAKIVLLQAEDLSGWIQKHPFWSRDALRRLALVNFNDDDKVAIINNLKQSHGIKTGVEADTKDFTDENFKTESSSATQKTLLCA